MTSGAVILAKLSLTAAVHNCLKFTYNEMMGSTSRIFFVLFVLLAQSYAAQCPPSDPDTLWREIEKITERPYKESKENLFFQAMSQSWFYLFSSDIVNQKERDRSKLYAGLGFSFALAQYFWQRRNYIQAKQEVKKVREETQALSTEQKIELFKEELERRWRKEKSGAMVSLISDFIGTAVNAFTLSRWKERKDKGEIEGDRLAVRTVALIGWSVYRGFRHASLWQKDRYNLSCFR